MDERFSQQYFNEHVAQALAMSEAITNLANVHRHLEDEDTKAIVKVAMDVCLNHMLPRPENTAELVDIFSGGKMQ